MRRLAITGFCAIALLSGCAGGGGGRTRIDKPVDLKCPGKNVKVPDIQVVEGQETKLTFDFKKKCKFTDFGWLGFPPGTDPHGFQRQHSPDPSQTIVIYSGLPIKPPGYTFTYINDDSTPDGNGSSTPDGSGSGIVKN